LKYVLDFGSVYMYALFFKNGCFLFVGDVFIFELWVQSLYFKEKKSDFLAK
jgi:hypothetical protein